MHAWKLLPRSYTHIFSPVEYADLLHKLLSQIQVHLTLFMSPFALHLHYFPLKSIIEMLLYILSQGVTIYLTLNLMSFFNVFTGSTDWWHTDSFWIGYCKVKDLDPVIAFLFRHVLICGFDPNGRRFRPLMLVSKK